MSNLKGIKELYDFKIKATYPIEKDGKTIEVGETIAFFERVQIFSLDLETLITKASGGYRNPAYIIWEDPKEVYISFSQGVINKDMFSLMVNANYLTMASPPKIEVPFTEKRESDEDGNIELKYNPFSDIFVRRMDTGEKVNFTLDGNIIRIAQPFVNLLIEYNFLYDGTVVEYKVGEELYSGFVSLEAKMRLKDDETGHTNTGILRIPKFKVMSDLSVTVGASMPPVLGNFQGIGYPTGRKGSTVIAEIFFLDDDIDTEL